MSSSHMKYFHKQPDITTNTGRKITIYELNVEKNIDTLEEWAKHLEGTIV